MSEKLNLDLKIHCSMNLKSIVRGRAVAGHGLWRMRERTRSVEGGSMEREREREEIHRVGEVSFEEF
jgi:hypothetical protein